MSYWSLFTCHSSLPFGRCGDGEQHRALPGPVVKVHQDDLLPGPERELTILNRDAEAGFEQRGAQVRVAVAVSPGPIVLVVGIHGSDLIERPLQVGQRARLVLNRS